MGRIVVDVSGLVAGELRAVEVEGRSLLVCQAEGAWYALENRCPHGGVPLDRGRLEGCVLQCPFHGGSLDVRDGSPRSLPIRRSVATFPARLLADGLEIELA